MTSSAQGENGQPLERGRSEEAIDARLGQAEVETSRRPADVTPDAGSDDEFDDEFDDDDDFEERELDDLD